MGEGPERLGAYCGCSDRREVWKSLSSIPAVFSAASTFAIAVLLASEASRAVLPSEATPASSWARSGGTEIEASPVTEIAGGNSDWASAGAAHSVVQAEIQAMAAAKRRSCFMALTSAAHRR